MLVLGEKQKQQKQAEGENVLGYILFFQMSGRGGVGERGYVSGGVGRIILLQSGDLGLSINLKRWGNGLAPWLD